MLPKGYPRPERDPRGSQGYLNIGSLTVIIYNSYFSCLRVVNENTAHTFSSGMRSIRMNTSISCHDFSGFNLLMTLVSCLTTAEIETTPRTQFCLTYVVMHDTIDFSWESLKGVFHKVGSLFRAFRS